MVDVVFALETPHGWLAAVTIPPEGAALQDAVRARLPEDEARLAAAHGPVRARAWLGGRLALREALARAGLGAGPVGSDDRGAPVLPTGIAGSVSHKRDVAVALVAAEPRAKLGVDVEMDPPDADAGARPRPDVSRRVLRDEELAELAALGDAERAREVLLRFSAKESIYKAVDPFVRRYVGFHEVALRVEADGTAEVAPHWANGEGPFRVDVRWMRRDGLVVTSARVER
jgi:4'-phosphopantetheinyl transferase EntD